MTTASSSPASGDGSLPARASITLRLHAPAGRAFSMFDPVNESLWSPEWHPTLLGDKRVEPGLVFTTAAEHGTATWLLDRYEPELGVIRYVIAREETLTTIDIAVVPEADASRATVTYTRTAVLPRAVDAVRRFAQEFPIQAPHWERAINAALDAGVEPTSPAVR